MYLAEMLMQEELEELSAEMKKGACHLSDLRSGSYDFYNESVITKLQNKIFHISEDLRDLFLEEYLTSLQEVTRSGCQVQDKEAFYNEIKIRLDKELAQYRNNKAKYISLNYGC